jgi:hypothetical protein
VNSLEILLGDKLHSHDDKKVKERVDAGKASEDDYSKVLVNARHFYS